jgi:hypothetical protein
MQYKGFDISAFEQEPGKWRTRIIRANSKPLKGIHRELLESATSTNLTSAVDALILAMEAVDAVGFSFRKTERFWRVLRRASETSERSAYPLAKKKPRRRRVSGQVGGVTDDIPREQELYNYILRELELYNLLMRRWGA